MARARTFPLGLLPPLLVGKPRLGDPASTSGRRPVEERVTRPLRNLVAPVISGTPTSGEVLTSTTLGSWSGDLPISYARQWLRDGVEISGATGDSILLSGADLGAHITCRITATNPLGSVAVESNALGPIASGGGVAPTITVAPVLTWTVAHGTSPTITPPTYTGDPATITYDLIRLPSTTVLSGVDLATAQAYVSDRATDVGPTWKITATATNGAGSDSADSNEVAYDPSSIASYYADYDADVGVEEASGDPAEDGDTVELWRDQSGGARDATQATAGSRPTLRVGTGPNGRNRLEFNQASVAKWMDATGVSLSSAHSSFLVARFDTTGTTAGLYDGITVRRALFKSGATWVIFAGSSIGNTGLPPGGWFLDEAEFNGASSSHRLNKGTAVTGNAGANNLTGLRLANVNGTPSTSLGFDGDIARGLFFSAVLSADDKADVRAYLAHLYGEPAWGAATPPALANLVSWWHGNGLTPTASTPNWRDDGTQNAQLTRLTANPVNVGIPVDGWQSYSGDGVAMENASATLAASADREIWVALRPDDLAGTQYVFDGVGGTNRCTLTVSPTGVVTVNAGSDVASAAGAVEEHRPAILRITIDAAGACTVYRATDVSSAIASPIASGTSGVGLWTGITIGADNAGASAWQGEIAEILRYDDILSDANAQAVASYLLARYPSAGKAARTPRNLACLGDSLVQGLVSASGRSFRLKLFRAFETNDLSPSETLVFRGTSEDRCLDHDGIGGETISEIEARAAAAISAGSPDVIVVMAGANDIVDPGYNQAVAEADYASLLATIYAAAPSVPVVVCLTPPMTDAYAAYNTLVTNLNAALEATVIPAADSTIYVVDPRDHGWTGSGYSTDGVHPNDLGEQALSDAIESGIRSAL